MTKIPLEIAVNPKLSLRILQKSDAHRIFELTEQNRQHLGKWLPWVEHTLTEADSLEFINGGLKELAEKKAFHYGIWSEGKLVGVVGAHTWEPENGYLELGYWLSQNAEGRGTMTSACKAIIQMAFDAKIANVIDILCEPANQRSSAIPKRLGLKLVKTVRKEQGNKLTTLDVYRTTPEIWKG